MSYRRDSKRLRRAQRQLKRQRHALLSLELQGIVALTLHSVAQSLTLALDSEAQGELVDLLLAALLRQRRAIQLEADQVRRERKQTHELPPSATASAKPPAAA